MSVQFAELSAAPDIIVATPGRLLHHLSEVPGFTLKSVEHIVLDEADRLFEMGLGSQVQLPCDLLLVGCWTVMHNRTVALSRTQDLLPVACIFSYLLKHHPMDHASSLDCRYCWFAGGGHSQADFRVSPGSPVLRNATFGTGRLCISRPALTTAGAARCGHQAVPHPRPALLQRPRVRQACLPPRAPTGMPLAYPL